MTPQFIIAQQHLRVEAPVRARDRLEPDGLHTGERAQVRTPSDLASFMASLAEVGSRATHSILDPGCGTGSLSVALVRRIMTESPGSSVRLVGCEVDPELISEAQVRLNA